jgi:hypothetical protein
VILVAEGRFYDAQVSISRVFQNQEISLQWRSVPSLEVSKVYSNKSIISLK